MLTIISKIKERYSHIDINVFIDFALAKKYDKNDITTYKHCITILLLLYK